MILHLYPEGLSASSVTYKPRVHQLYRLPPLNIWLCWNMFCKPFYLCSVFIIFAWDTLYCGSGLLWTQYELMALTDDGTVHRGASLACPFRIGPTLKCSNENAANALQSELLIVGPCLECIASYPHGWLLLGFWSLCWCQQESRPFYSTLMFSVMLTFLFLHNEVQTCPKTTK